jgi:transposase
MSSSTLLPCLKTIAVDSVTTVPETIVLRLSTLADTVACPLCGHASQRVHSHYQRTLTDLPWNRITVRIHLRSRKFFCDNASCVRRVFTEPVPELAARYARKTVRLADALLQLVYMVGGEAGARIAQLLGLQVSPDALLERIKQPRRSAPSVATPRVLGIDDFAFRKGFRYGTLLVDLERGRPIDLLPDREGATVETWLRAHPGIQIISRDRAMGYANAIRQAAPDAIAVADRFHIMKNLMEALEKQVAGEYGAIRQLLAPPAAPASEETPPTRWQDRRAQQSRERRLARWQHVRDLSAQGHTQQQIASKIGLSEKTVRGSLRARTFPERRISPCPPGKMDVHHAYLRNRWEQGCHNALQLWRELKQQGHSVSATMVRDYARTWRAPATAPPPEPTRRTVPSVRALAWLLLPQRRHTPEQVQMRQTLLEALPTLQQSQHLVQSFRNVLKKQSVAELATWMESVVGSGLTPLVSFARGLEADRQAVEAAVTQSWSNGPTEGQVNRLKFVKRQGYGRASFALLKARTLPLAA